MSFDVSGEAAGSAVAFAESMRQRFELLMRSGDMVAVRRPQRITKEISDRVVAMARDGVRLYDICRKAVISEPSARRILRAAGLKARGMHSCPQNNRTPERRAKGMRLLAQGRDTREVARACGVTRSAVIHWQRRLEKERERAG